MPAVSPPMPPGLFWCCGPAWSFAGKAAAPPCWPVCALGRPASSPQPPPMPPSHLGQHENSQAKPQPSHVALPPVGSAQGIAGTHTHTHTHLTPGSQARISDTRSQHAGTQEA